MTFITFINIIEEIKFFKMVNFPLKLTLAFFPRKTVGVAKSKDSQSVEQE